MQKEIGLNFEAKMLRLTFPRLKFEKHSVIFEISAFELVKMQTVLPKEKTLNLEPKMLYLLFLGWNWKNLLSYKITNLKLMEKLGFMLKKLNLGPKMPYLGIFRMEFAKKLLLFLN